MSVLLVATGIELLMLGIVPASSGSPSRYEGYSHGVYLPYLNAPASRDDITTSPRLRISFGEGNYDVVMDTGSTGVVVSANKIPNLHSLQSLGPGQLTYSSSGRIMMGEWVLTPMAITGGDGTRVATAAIPVLAVTRVECTQLARRCTPNAAPQRISMMGIGFGRRGDHQRQNGSDKNPFLNVADLNGGSVQPFRRGYIVTRRGVYIGLTAANTRDEFSYVKLARAADGLDWAP